MANTGIKTVLTLRKYVDGVATSEIKANVLGDPDYIAPYEDLVDCPVEGSTTTSTTTEATTTSTTIPTTPPPPTTTTTTEPSCTCVTVDVLNTQLTDGGLNLYYIFNSCGVGETSVDLNNYFGIEQNGSTYFAFCQTGSSSNMYKYGPSGNAFVGLPGMNTNPNQTSCVDNLECTPVVP